MLEGDEKLSERELLQAGYRYGWSLSSNKQDTEDLVHDAWIRLIKRYDEVPSKSLLFTTIRNLYIDQLRHEKHVVKHQQEGRFSLTLNSEEVEPDFIRRDEIQFLLSKLRDVENEALFLSLVEGYTAQEIAKMTSSTRGSVLSLLHRSRQKLSRWLNEDKLQPSNVVKLVRGAAKE